MSKSIVSQVQKSPKEVVSMAIHVHIAPRTAGLQPGKKRRLNIQRWSSKVGSVELLSTYFSLLRW